MVGSVLYLSVFMLMQWVMLTLVIVGLIVLSGRYPKLAFGILGTLLASGAVILWLTSDKSFDLKRAGVDVIKVDNTAVIPAYAGSFRLTGRLINRHESIAIREVILSIIMRDCPTANGDSPDCLIVGQTTERLNLDIPASQARDFATTIYLGEPAISGMIHWQFEITDARQ